LKKIQHDEKRQRKYQANPTPKRRRMNTPESSINQVESQARNKEIDDDDHRNSKPPEDLPGIVRTLEYHEATIQSVNAVNQKTSTHEFGEVRHDHSS
jgi:hypothetical protein